MPQRHGGLKARNCGSVCSCSHIAFDSLKSCKSDTRILMEVSQNHLVNRLFLCKSILFPAALFKSFLLGKSQCFIYLFIYFFQLLAKGHSLHCGQLCTKLEHARHCDGAYDNGGRGASLTCCCFRQPILCSRTEEDSMKR